MQHSPPLSQHNLKCRFSATRDSGDFLKWLADQSEGMAASLSTAVVQN